MSVFFTDTDLELHHTKIKELGINLIKMPFTLGDEILFDDGGESVDLKNYFTKVSTGTPSKTQALNMEEYVEYFEPVLAKGEDIIYVHFSSQMSGTFNSMNMAIDELLKKYPERKITTVDTLSISLGGGLIVYEAAKLHNNGANDEEVKEYVENNRQNISCLFTVDNLMYLKRGGRLNATSAVVGTILGVKPIIKVDEEGKLNNFAKVSGRKKALNFLIDYVKQNALNIADYPIGILHADCEEDGKYVEQKIREFAGPDANIWLQYVGPTIGAHCGKGTVGVAFHAKKR